MNKEIDPYLEVLRQSPDFVRTMSEIIKHRPTVPRHDPTDDNTELWKSLSAQQAGFDLCVYLLTGMDT